MRHLVLALLTVALATAPLGAQSSRQLPIMNLLWTDLSPDSSSQHAVNPDAASGGRVNGLAASRDQSLIIAASEWGGLWKSADTGRTWHHIDTHVPVATFGVAIDPTNARKVYATSFYDGRVRSLAGVNVSSDGGTSWTHPVTSVPSPRACADSGRAQNPSAFGISISKNHPRTVAVGTNCGLLLSTDAGMTWKQIFNSIGDVWSVVVHDNDIIDFCGDDGHRRSVDGGAHWTTSATAPLPTGQCSIAVAPGNANQLIATVNYTQLYQSMDGGASWQLFNMRTNHPDSGMGRLSMVATNVRAGHAFDLYYGYAMLYRGPCADMHCPVTPADSAQPFWINIGYYSGAHLDVGTILFDPSVDVDACPLLLSNDGGIERNAITTSPACHAPKWVQPAKTPHALWLRGMELTQTLSRDSTVHDSTGLLSVVPFSGINTYHRIIFGTQDNGSFQTDRANASAGVPWSNTDGSDATDAVGNTQATVNTVCCWGYASHLFLRVINEGAILDTTARPLALPSGRTLLQSEHAIALARENHFAILTDSGLFVTYNVLQDKTWSSLGWPTRPPGLFGSASLFVSADNGGPVFYVRIDSAGAPSQVWQLTGAHLFETAPAILSPSALGTWRRITPPGDSGGFGVFVADPANPNRLFASQARPGRDPRMMHSTDAGVTWKLLPALDRCMTHDGVFRYTNMRGPTGMGTGKNPFMGYSQPTLVAYGAPADEGRVLLAGAADAGIFASFDSGDSWRLLTEPVNPVIGVVPHLPRPTYIRISDGPSGSFAYFGSVGRGIWRIFFPRQQPRVPVFAPSC